MENRSILIVDDENDIAASLQVVLSSFLPDLSVETASSGGAAMRLVGEKRFDLIISDYRMPGMNGVEFLQQVREVQPDARRVLLTAYADATLDEAARETADVLAVLTKPVRREPFIATIEDLLSRTA